MKSEIGKTYYIKGWTLPQEFPYDTKSKKDQKELFIENGNGWWWYRNASDKAMTELTPSERNLKRRGGSLSKSGGRRGL